MGEHPLGTGTDLVDQALANLVNQFARPLDFLRELVQNSIDAGTPRIEVWVRHQGEVLEVHVDDFGDGMDEAIIDNQLTRLFSSTKEDDLTKIGKFGIGFTSIFAIDPDAVLLHTGRHGENWELLFHQDRSFEKVRVDTPVDGTKITLFKRMDPEDVPGFVREARWVLSYWCEHSGIPITFDDRTGQTDTAPQPPDDVFATFEAPTQDAPDRQVNGPFALDAPLSVDVTVDDVRVLLGVTHQPSYGFYNGGLTLISTENPEVLGPHADRLGHLIFKLRCDALEHTLTRDNVLRDAHWEAAMAAIEQAATQLRTDLLARVTRAVVQDEDADTWLGHLARECAGSELHAEGEDFLDRPLCRDLGGQLRTLHEVRDQAEDLDAVLLASGQPELDQALVDEGLVVLPDRPGVRALLRVVVADTGFSPFRQDLPAVGAQVLFVLPRILGPDALNPVEDRFLVALRSLFKAATGRRLHLELGDFGGPQAGRSEALFVEGPRDGRVFQRPEGRRVRLPARVRRRCMLVNRHHDYLQLQLAASVDDLILAAFSVAQVLLTDEDAERERTYVKLMTAAVEALA